MIKNHAGIGLFISKAMCVALTLVLGSSLFAAGAFADLGCGEKCRCHRSPMDMDHSKGDLIPLSADFCNGDPMIPCDLEAGQASELPADLALTDLSNLTYTDAPADMAADFFTDNFNFRGEASYQLVREKFQSASIYLKNVSFLI